MFQTTPKWIGIMPRYFQGEGIRRANGKRKCTATIIAMEAAKRVGGMGQFDFIGVLPVIAKVGFSPVF